MAVRFAAAWQVTGGAGARGIELGSVETVAGSVQTTWITDPDGNRVQIGQPGRADVARCS